MDLSHSTAYFRESFVPFDEAQLSIASAPVLYGLSIYTVIPVFWNDKTKKLYAFRIKDHFRRLQNSANIMAFNDFIKEWDYARFEQMVQDILNRNKMQQDCLVRITVFVDDILSGTRMKNLRHSLSAFVYPATPLFPVGGVRLGVSSWLRTPDNAIPSRAKINGSYANSALMKHEALQNGFDDAVSLDGQGHVTESTIANLFLLRGGRLLTPADSTDLLEGITRDTVFKLAEQATIPYQQRAIDRSELYLADEVFLCGSSIGITPATSVDHRSIDNGKPGPITKKIRSSYNAIVRNDAPAPDKWLTEVV